MVAQKLGGNTVLTEQEIAMKLLEINVEENFKTNKPKTEVLNWLKNETSDDLAKKYGQFDVLVLADCIWMENLHET
eukprot:UN04056